MYDKIIEKLNKIEQKENVRIIYAAESGSRAWGFASDDSDYDVRFIYIRNPEFYLKLEKTSDVIEILPDKVFDINGWDIKKALILLHKSNPTLFEWANSPVIYRCTSEWEELKSIINRYFNSKAGIYHYLNMAKGNYRAYFVGKQTVSLKKYFYVLRPILAYKWILEHNTPPPMLFTELAESELEENMKPIVYDLLKYKINSHERTKTQPVQVLNEYIEYNFENIQRQINTISKYQLKGYEELNRLFLSFAGNRIFA